MGDRLFHVEHDWYEWRQRPALAAEVQVRVVPRADGRLVLAELRVVGEPTSELLRAIPVGRIEAAANAQLTAVDATVVAASSAGLRRRPGAGGSRDANGRRANGQGWEQDGPAETPGRGGPAIRPGRGRRGGSAGSGAAASGRGRPDRFYAGIADRYRRLAQSSHRPAVELAAQDGVPVTTAHRWIKEARRRGYLSPGRPGKAG